MVVCSTTLPTVDMTSNNFTATLEGLTATGSWGTGSLNVYLYDMGDGTEDGNVNYNDFNSTQGALIESRAHVMAAHLLYLITLMSLKRCATTFLEEGLQTSPALSSYALMHRHLNDMLGLMLAHPH